MAKKIYKHRRSRFDPYRGEIEHLLAAGCTTGQITDAMQVHFGETYITESSVYYYIRSNGLKTTVTKGARDGRVYIQRCRDCEKRCCVINTTGRRVWGCRVSDSEIRLVSRSISTSPMWCEKRDELSECEEQRDSIQEKYDALTQCIESLIEQYYQRYITQEDIIPELEKMI